MVKEGERAGAKKPRRGVLGCPARMKRKNVNFGTFALPNHRREEGDLKWARQNASRALRRCAVRRGGWMGRGRNLRGGGEATTWLLRIRFRVIGPLRCLSYSDTPHDLPDRAAWKARLDGQDSTAIAS